MTRIILLGETPPSLMGEAKIEAAHYRTAQFLEPLQGDGHEIFLVTPKRKKRDSEAMLETEDIRHHVEMDFDSLGWVTELQVTADSFKPDCIVAVNFDFCLYASKLQGEAPIWMDIYGDPLTIMQAAAYRVQSDRGLTTVTGFLRQVLQAGDIFSVCGTPQLHMLVGELAMSGRLNRSTFGYEFGRVILPGSRDTEEATLPTAPPPREFLPSFGVAENSFVVLWAGGYNTWTDVDTLFEGLTAAMRVNPRIMFVSVGASTYHGPDNVYERFLKLVSASDVRSNFLFLGWRPWKEMEYFYRESDLGINIDSLHYETVYGTRTRLVEMIGFGLPVVTTYGTELSSLLVGAAGALGFHPGNAAELSERLLTVAGSPAVRQGLAVNALAYARNSLAWGATTAPLREWVLAPQYAPDHSDNEPKGRLEALEYESRARVRWVLWRLRGAYR